MKTWIEMTAAAALILVFVALAGSSAYMKSATVDEFAHLPAGLYAWKTYEFNLYPKTPPTGRMFVTAPALLANPQVDIYLDRFPDDAWRPWTYATDFMRQNIKSYGKILAMGRAGAILAGVIVCLMVWVAAREGYGEIGGLVALAACALSPTMIAHARLVTTDVPAALFSFLFVITLMRYFDGPSVVKAAVMAMALGLTILTKFTCLFWVPFALLAPFLSAFTGFTESIDRPGVGRALFHLVVVVVMCWLVLVGGYLGKDFIGPHQDFEPSSNAMKSVAPLVKYAPLPRDLKVGLDRQLLDAQAGEWTREDGNYLMGEWYSGSRWYYFLVALAAKESVPLMVLFLWSVFLAISRGPRDRDELVIIFITVSFTAAASLLGSLQIGIRYLLPVYPVAFLLIGKAGEDAFLPIVHWPKGWEGREPPPQIFRKIVRIAARVLLGLLLIWALGLHARAWPNYISYFNELAEGPEHGSELLLDSNIDWGQDLPGLAKWMKKNGVDAIDLAYFGHDDPVRFGITYSLPARDSDNQYIAISVNLLEGKKYPMTFLSPGVTKEDPLWDEIARYRDRQPAAEIGYSILVFEK